MQTVVSISDQPNHDLQVAEIAGQQKSPDPDWNNANMSYWGLGDFKSGSGTQRGYFNNVRASGDRDWGEFDGRVTTTGTSVTLEGTFTFTGGTGKFSGLTGNGTYRGRMTSPTQVEMEWKGTYQIAGTKTSATVG